jgi:hypothetical protein
MELAFFLFLTSDVAFYTESKPYFRNLAGLLMHNLFSIEIAFVPV